ncbi:Succinate--hydroxymethylglutarate CoA-transferase [Hypsizygus marmoreus]|uniref:Succinate--hydroxymethylglutarate CoA-transferase n=1 Tax=Hypsizygus marmoreus TaxID=39966 RepID=A0A369J213_HYPMA|nr:Succinate--hydroxymethylglutarate CoA-transferase [Hypsizygus marmoreus]
MSSSPAEAAKDLWLSVGLPPAELSNLHFNGNADSAVNSSFKLGVAAQASIGLAGLSAVCFHSLRTGVEQDVSVNARHAVLNFHSEAWYTVDGKLPEGGVWDNIAGVYTTKDDGFVRIHTNFPHHRKGILDILNIPDTAQMTKDDVSRAMRTWNAVDFETAAASKGMCATAMRSFSLWDEHPQAKALQGVMPVTLARIGDAPKREIAQDCTYPMQGIRVLDLSRVLAGPIAGRTLAAQGADVLLISSPNLPALPFLDIETSLGKRTTQLELTDDVDREKLIGLAKDADVFLQAYRPGGLQEKGFGATDLAILRPGLVCASLTAWGWEGPWKDRRGFDSLVQTASGFNVAEAEAYMEYQGLQVGPHMEPKALPMQALDHAAAYLLAFGINAALCRTITEGGSWEVRVSLAGVGQWIRSLGRVAPKIGFGEGQPFPHRLSPPDPEIQKLSMVWHQSGGGGGREMTAIKQAAVLSKTPAKEGCASEAPIMLNAHKPVWLPRK